MKAIEVRDTGWDIRRLYAEATTPARRALMGYMLYTGRSDDLVFGGAFQLLKDIEELNGKMYNLKFESPNSKEIVAIVEVARAGGFKKFALSKQSVKATHKRIVDILA